MIRILGISGSLRQASYNSALLRAAQRLMPEGAELIEGSIAGIPLYNGDDEAATGIPPVVQALKDRIGAADGLLLFTPEYNNSIPGVFKNAIATGPAGRRRTSGRSSAGGRWRCWARRPAGSAPSCRRTLG
jgi:chromate reductase, NAD(P)H dehydrogenase (quinone)